MTPQPGHGLSACTDATCIMIDAPAEGDAPPSPAELDTHQSTTGELNRLLTGSQPGILNNMLMLAPAPRRYYEFTQKIAKWILKGLARHEGSRPDSTQIGTGIIDDVPCSNPAEAYVLWGGTVAVWRSGRQPTIATSTNKAVLTTGLRHPTADDLAMTLPSQFVWSSTPHTCGGRQHA